MCYACGATTRGRTRQILKQCDIDAMGTCNVRFTLFEGQSKTVRTRLKHNNNTTTTHNNNTQQQHTTTTTHTTTTHNNNTQQQHTTTTQHNNTTQQHTQQQLFLLSFFWFLLGVLCIWGVFVLLVSLLCTRLGLLRCASCRTCSLGRVRWEALPL